MTMNKREKQIQAELRAIAELWYKANNPHYSVYKIAERRYMACVRISPLQPSWVVGMNYTTEAEAENAARIKLQELLNQE